MEKEKLYAEAVSLLKKLIGVPSFSGEEEGTRDILLEFFHEKQLPVHCSNNNVWAYNQYFDPAKPTILLNSHHDTVKPAPGYDRDPFVASVEADQLFGLGSNDAGASLVSLLAAFVHFYPKAGMRYNIVLAATAEEEISGAKGIESILSDLPPIDLAIVGEPTEMNLAIAEKGLMVLDCTANGTAGHAAREEGENAVYKALQAVEWFSTFRFPKISPTLGAVKMSVTSISTENKAHNVVPAVCSFVVDVRVTDVYTHEEILETIKENVNVTVRPRSMRLRSSSINPDHPVVQAGIKLGKTTYGSVTSSDAALISAPVLKCGPGDSARSHTANEFIFLKEIEEGINGYIQLLQPLLQPVDHSHLKLTT